MIFEYEQINEIIAVSKKTLYDNADWSFIEFKASSQNDIDSDKSFECRIFYFLSQFTIHP